jgi:hypothetical protein
LLRQDQVLVGGGTPAERRVVRGDDHEPGVLGHVLAEELREGVLEADRCRESHPRQREPARPGARGEIAPDAPDVGDPVQVLAEGDELTERQEVVLGIAARDPPVGPVQEVLV